MKNIVNKGKSKQIQSKFKLSDGTVTTNKDMISSKFNDLFVYIGPTLAKKIPNQSLSPLHFMGIGVTLWLIPFSDTSYSSRNDWHTAVFEKWGCRLWWYQCIITLVGILVYSSATGLLM